MNELGQLDLARLARRAEAGIDTVQAEHLDNDLVQYVEDFPAEAAANVLKAWLTGPGGPRTLDDGVLRDELGEWAEFLLREQDRINHR